MWSCYPLTIFLWLLEAMSHETVKKRPNEIVHYSPILARIKNAKSQIFPCCRAVFTMTYLWKTVFRWMCPSARMAKGISARACKKAQRSNLKQKQICSIFGRIFFPIYFFRFWKRAPHVCVYALDCVRRKTGFFIVRLPTTRERHLSNVTNVRLVVQFLSRGQLLLLQDAFSRKPKHFFFHMLLRRRNLPFFIYM